MNAVELIDASVTYGWRTVWSNANVAIPAGALAVVIGPNGAGKSTLIRAVLGLTALSAGSVLVNGTSPRRGSDTVGYVAQRRVEDAASVVRSRSLVELGLDGARWGMRLYAGRTRRRAQVDRALERVGASAFAERTVGTLSGGEAQRVAMAQAIVSEPSLLLLDEPFAGLDLTAQATIARLVAEIVKGAGITAILVTHNLNGLLPYADLIISVSGGRIVTGPPSAIVTSERLSDIYGSSIVVLSDEHGDRYVVGTTL